VHLGANALLQAEHVRTLAGAAIEGADWFYAPLELSHDAVRTALELARASGGRTVLNPSPFAPMDAGFWALCDGLVVNESEAQALLGLPTSGHGDTPATSVWSTRQWTGWLGNQPELAWGGHKWSGQWLVVTLADQGAVMWQRGGCVCWEPALNATPVVDTVGCGDAFLCGFLTAWAGTGDAATALRAGNACGAHVAAQRGVLNALPHQAQLAGWLAVDAATHSV
jgi:ribokinase